MAASILVPHDASSMPHEHSFAIFSAYCLLFKIKTGQTNAKREINIKTHETRESCLMGCLALPLWVSVSALTPVSVPPLITNTYAENFSRSWIAYVLGHLKSQGSKISPKWRIRSTATNRLSPGGAHVKKFE